MGGTAIIILAAGNSTRLGRPKQVLIYRGRSLIGNVVSEAGNAGLWPVIVVTGAYEKEVSNELLGHHVQLVHNKEWEKGMGSGISKGLASLLEIIPDLNGVIIAVCDQPFVSSALFQQMVKKRAETGNGIVACEYAGTLGTPVLFGSGYFDVLLKLDTDGGAKQLLKLHDPDVAGIPFPQGNIDIDTEADYLNLGSA